jgi:hypothetical protein
MNNKERDMMLRAEPILVSVTVQCFKEDVDRLIETIDAYPILAKREAESIDGCIAKLQEAANRMRS